MLLRCLWYFFSIHHNLPSAAPLTSCRELEHVTVWKYGPALRPLRELAAESGQDPAEFATPGRICTTLAPDWKRVEPGRRGWGVGTSNPEGKDVEIGRVKVDTVTNTDDSGQVSRNLVRQDRYPQRGPGERMHSGHTKRVVWASLGVEEMNGTVPSWGLRSPRQ